MLNGVTSEETLSQAFGPEKVLYAVAQGMDAVREDNRLTCTQEGTLFLGVPEEDYFDRGDKLEAVWSLFPPGGGGRPEGGRTFSTGCGASSC